MTGIEKQLFLDKTTCFREVGDGLMVVDGRLATVERVMKLVPGAKQE